MSIQIKSAVGALIVASSTNRMLLTLRAPHKTHPLTWSLFGGMIEEGETPQSALDRELTEEMGFIPDFLRVYPFDVYYSKDNIFKHVSFVAVIEDEFVPELNSESCGYCWVDVGIWPAGTHRGARSSFGSKRSQDKIQLILSQHTSQD